MEDSMPLVGNRKLANVDLNLVVHLNPRLHQKLQLDQNVLKLLVLRQQLNTASNLELVVSHLLIGQKRK